MACCLLGAKPLSEPMLPFCQLDPKEYVSVKFYSKFESFMKGNALANVASASMCWLDHLEQTSIKLNENRE